MATITAAARTLYPHDALPDEVYSRVADKLADAAREDPDVARTIEEGSSTLAAGRPFADVSADDRLEALRAIEGSEFFELMRATAVREVYSDRRTWRLLGYEGPSFDNGGYLRRGFDDLDWLADPEQTS